MSTSSRSRNPRLSTFFSAADPTRRIVIKGGIAAFLLSSTLGRYAGRAAAGTSAGRLLGFASIPVSSDDTVDRKSVV